MDLIFDIETDGLLETVTKVHCIVAKDADTGERYVWFGEALQAGLTVLASAKTLIGHNIQGYDLPALAKVHNFRYTGVVRDTLLCGRLIWPDIKQKDFINWKAGKLPGNLIGSHSLKAWGYRLGVLKGEFGETTDWKEFSEDMLKYCMQDVEVTDAFWKTIKGKNYSEEAIQLEHAFAAIIRRQEAYGFCFNEKAALELYQELAKKRQELREKLQAAIPGWDQETKTPDYWTLTFAAQFAGGITEVGKYSTKGEAEKARKELGLKPKDCFIEPGPMRVKHTAFNPGSRDHIARLFFERYSWQPKEFTDSGKPVIDDEVLSSLVFPEAKILSEYFLLEKRIGQLAEGDNAWLKLCRKGKIHGRVNTNGAVTGRCTHSDPNLGQVPACYSPYGKECRALFGPPEGMVQVGADASGLELRCLAHYMGRYDNGAYAKELLEGDIHTANQNAAGLPTRDNAKTFIYGFLYGAGDEKIGSIVGKGSAEGKRLKEQFLKKTPALKKLRDNIQAVAQQRGYLLGLDKRILPVRHLHAALNTLLQSAGAVAMKKALVLLDETLQASGMVPGVDYEFMGNIHDEWQIAVTPEYAQVVGAHACSAITQAGQHFGFRCPLAGEFKVGANWAGTH